MITCISVRRQELCSCCRSAPPINGQAYCAWCRNWIARAKRPKYRDLSPLEQHKADARSVAKMAVRRGTLVPQPCEIQGCQARAEKHHDDYDRPLDVHWLCPAHHRALHHAGHDFSTSANLPAKTS